MTTTIKPRNEREDQPFVLVPRDQLLPLTITDVEKNEISSRPGVKELEEKENIIYDKLYARSMQYRFTTSQQIKEDIKEECESLWKAIDTNGKLHREYLKLAGLPDYLFGTLIYTPLQRRRWSNYSLVRYTEHGDNRLRTESYIEPNKYEKIDYYSEEELGKVGPAGREFYKKNPNAAPPGHFDRYPEDRPIIPKEEWNTRTKEMFGEESNVSRMSKSFSERIEEDVDILDNRNRTPNDTEEISKLWDYWAIIKTAQLFAGPNANDESASCYKADLEMIKSGIRPTQCQDDEELILLCDELQRISDEINKLKGVKGMTPQKLTTVEICKCGSGKIVNRGYYQEGKLYTCCEDCVKNRKGRFDYTCSSCWKVFRDVSFGYLNKESKLVCDGCK